MQSINSDPRFQQLKANMEMCINDMLNMWLEPECTIKFAFHFTPTKTSIDNVEYIEYSGGRGSHVDQALLNVKHNLHAIVKKWMRVNDATISFDFPFTWSGVEEPHPLDFEQWNKTDKYVWQQFMVDQSKAGKINIIITQVD